MLTQVMIFAVSIRAIISLLLMDVKKLRIPIISIMLCLLGWIIIIRMIITSSRASGGCGGVYTLPINENFSLLSAKRGKFFSKFYPISLKNSYTPPLTPPPPQSWGPRAVTDNNYFVVVVEMNYNYMNDNNYFVVLVVETNYNHTNDNNYCVVLVVETNYNHNDHNNDFGDVDVQKPIVLYHY